MLFLARNNQTFAHTLSLAAANIHTEAGEDEGTGLNNYSGRQTKIVMEAAKRALKHAASETAKGVAPAHLLFRKGDVLQARRRKLNSLDWGKGNIQPSWHVAEVIKVSGADI